MARSHFEERVADWMTFHKKNPLLWQYFEEFALEALAKGHTKLSPWLVMNRVRWEVAFHTTEKDFKISNNRISFYSRYFLATHPQFEGFFRVKRMRGETDRHIEDFTHKALEMEAA
jgi:hypothetical protein